MYQTIRSTEFHYEEHGTGVPIVNLHGWPADRRQMIAMMDRCSSGARTGVGSTSTFPAWG